MSEVLLVNQNWRKHDAVTELPMITPPLNLMYVAQSLIGDGHDVTILDAFILNLDVEEMFSRILSSKADIVGFPLYSSGLTEMHMLTTRLKQEAPHKLIFLAGPHVSGLPHETAHQFPHVDYFIREEGEHVARDLIRAIERDDSVSQIDGLTYFDGDRVVHNPTRNAMLDLDALPIPSRDLIDTDLYYTRLTNTRKIDILITSRGCPYRCTYCHRDNDNFLIYRKRSVDNIIEEMRHIQDRGIHALEIYDEIFTFDQKRVYELLREMKREKLDFEFRIRTRVDHVDSKLLAALRRGGCQVISYGVESGNQQVLDAIQKRTNTQKVRDAFRKTEAEGIDILGFFMIGNRGDTPETIQQTIDLAHELTPLYATFAVLYPYPGTPDYIQAKQNGTLVGDYAPGEPLPWVKLPWTTSREDLESLSRLAYNSYYRRPAYVNKFARSVLRNRNWNLLSYCLTNLWQKNLSSINAI